MDSEFRKDLVAGEWVLIAAGRRKRPNPVKPRESNYQKQEDCPFENLGDLAVNVIPNKFPAVAPGTCEPIKKRGEYQTVSGVGIHRLAVMKDHEKQLHSFTKEEMSDVIVAYRDQYKAITKEDQCAQYIMIFNNYGREGGASIYHPHSQIISMPVIPPSVMRSLRGSYDYFKKHEKEAHAVMIENEILEKKRIIYENDQFIAFCPFVSKRPYEVRIYPKFASAHFDNIEDMSVAPFTEAFCTALQKVKIGLNDPAYNFYIHTAPIHFEHTDLSFDQYYRWHVEIIPRVSFDAGFEVGTGIRINIIDPDFAAETFNST